MLCLTGPAILTKEEWKKKIKEFLYEQLEEERGLTACLIIHTFNKNKEKVYFRIILCHLVCVCCKSNKIFMLAARKGFLSELSSCINVCPSRGCLKTSKQIFGVLMNVHLAGCRLCGHIVQVLGKHNPEPDRREVPQDSPVK